MLLPSPCRRENVDAIPVARPADLVCASPRSRRPAEDRRHNSGQRPPPATSRVPPALAFPWMNCPFTSRSPPAARTHGSSTGGDHGRKRRGDADVLVADQPPGADGRDRVLLQRDVLPDLHPDDRLVIPDVDGPDRPDLHPGDLDPRPGLQPLHRAEHRLHRDLVPAPDLDVPQADRQPGQAGDPDHHEKPHRRFQFQVFIPFWLRSVTPLYGAFEFPSTSWRTTDCSSYSPVRRPHLDLFPVDDDDVMAHSKSGDVVETITS
jgi:hypothetical protein